MPDIRIERPHHLGLAKARELAFHWAEEAEQGLDMDCTYEEGKTEDVVRFSRSGVSGELVVLPDRFVLAAKLGFLLGAFKDRIETEIVKNLDELLAHEDPVAASAAKAAKAKAANGKASAKAGAKAGKTAAAPARSRKA